MLGTLNVNSSTALGTGTFAIDGGTTIDNTSGGAVTLSNNNAQTWNGSFTFTGTRDLNLGTGNVTMATDTTITVSGNVLTVGGAISGSHALTKAGTGTLILSSTGNAQTSTEIDAGTLVISGDGSLGVSTADLTFTGSGTLKLDGVADVTLNSGRTVSIADTKTATFDTNGKTMTVEGTLSGSSNPS